MRILPTLIMACLCVGVYAQKPPIKFGDIPDEDLKMKIYPQDSSVSAMVLGDYGESKFVYNEDKGFVLRFDRHRRVKIFRKEGYGFADFTIPLYHSGSNSETLGAMKAVTYNLENGKVVETKMKDANMFREKYDNNINLIKITFPNVKEGSVVEISYSVTSEFLFNLQDWEFQSTIPTRWSEYRTKIPEYFSYQRYMQGYVSLAVNDETAAQEVLTFTQRDRGVTSISGTSRQASVSTSTLTYTYRAYRWVTKDVPAFKEEPNMTNTIDYVSKINFELASIQMPNSIPKMYMNSWQDLNNEFLQNDNFGGAVKGSGFLNKVAEEQTAGVTDAKEKVAKLYHFVKANMEWDGTYRKYVDESLKKAFEDHKGSSSEINLMLVSLLQKAGFKADPVLISTRNHGFIRKQYPLSSQFNYVLCSVPVDGKMLLLDATDRSLPINILPERCLNGEGFIIAEQGSGWLNIVPNFKSKTISNFALTIDEGGAMSGTLNIAREGYEAQKMRKLYSVKGEETYINELASAHQWELANSKFDNTTTKLGEAVKESHEVKIAEHIQSAGDIFYLNPMISNKIHENPFKAETRTYPVDFGSPFEQMTIGKFAIPAGYEVAELPAAKMVVLPEGGGRYAYNVVKLGDNIQFTSQLVINKALFSQDEYPTVREFYNQVVAKQAEQIVIKKK